MATFPDALLTSYIPGGTPIIKALDLNSIQIAHVQRSRDIRGQNLVIADDFTGDQLNRNIWTALVGGAAVSFGVDTTITAGAINLACAASPGQMQAQALGIGTVDFRIIARLKWAWSAGTSSNGLFGMGYALGGLQNLVFQVINTQPNVQMLLANGSSIDTGVVVPTGYAVFEIRKTGSTVFFLINDVQVYSAAWTTSLSSVGPWIGFTTSGATSNVSIDYIKGWAERQPVTNATAAAVLGSHVEVQEVSFSGGTGLMTFNQAFANANYHVVAGPPSETGAIPSIGYRAANKLTNQITLDATSAGWSGTATIICFE